MPVITVKMGVRPDRDARRRLRAALAQYRAACAYAGEMRRWETTSRNGLHGAVYLEAVAAFPQLPPATLQLAQARAATAWRAYLTARERGREASAPTFSRAVPLAVRRDYYRLERSTAGDWTVRFRPLRGAPRLTLPVQVADYHAGRLGDLEAGRCRLGPLEVWEDGEGRWWLGVTLVYAAPAGAGGPPPGGWIGVDLGLRHRAATSTGRFVTGRPLLWRKARAAARRAGLQAAGRLARVKRESGKERRRTREENHALARQLVRLAEAEGTGLALERLVGIRERTAAGRKLNRQLHGWAFAELQGLIVYKAALAGVPIRQVDPRDTSRTCPRCGHVAAENRKGSVFRCRTCGYQTDSDRAAALNIAARAARPGR